MLPVTHRNYEPVSREDHHKKMDAFIKSLEGLPPGKYEYQHLISDGVYIRQMKLTKGTLVVGAVHKRETATVILKGSIKVFSENGLKILDAGTITVSPPGTQRAMIAIEDVTVATLHRCDSLNIAEIVAELAEGDVSNLGGVVEGQYRLFINGRKIRDEKIQHTCQSNIDYRSVQRLLFD